MEPFAFGELELSILKIVDKLGRATVHEVCGKLVNKRSYTTVMTVMSRLAEKGDLNREKVGKQYVYWGSSENRYRSQGLLQRIRDTIFGGKSAEMVSYLIEINQEISDEELSEIEDKIQQKRLQSKKMDKFALFTFNVFLNSFLAFFTAAALIEGIIFLFRIRQGRGASFLRMMPIFKLPFDLFYYDFIRWSYTQGINPLMCEEGSRSLSVILGWSERCPIITSGIQFIAPESLTFTLADVISYFLNSNCLVIFSFLLIGSSLAAFLRKIFVYCRFSKLIKPLQEAQTFKKKPINNPSIKGFFKKKRISVTSISGMGGSPFVAGLISKVIYLPSFLEKKLTQKEYEAVLAHEVEHIRKKDPLLRCTLGLIGAVFWWVPTQWLRKRVEEGQEVACDLYSERYGVASTDLASAICKSAKESLPFSGLQGIHHLTKHSIQKRVNLLLGTPRRYMGLHSFWSFVAILLSFLTIFLGRLWIF